MDVFLTPGTYDFFLVGGGASGRYGSRENVGQTGTGGGGSGHTQTRKGIKIAEKHPYAVVIGSGGAESANQSSAVANAGSATAISGKELPGEALTAKGGLATTMMPNSDIRGTDGGSGGGGAYSGKGGSDGSNGSESPNGGDAKGSYGQGVTTRSFGEISGTLYAGGGGGGGANHTDNSGKGGGGKGQYNDGITAHPGTAGTPNTGGGGGGGACETPYSYRTGLKGGSGLIIVRWLNG